jgi:GPH family glycoside/pentoside/hexuronide:cation symporter
MSETDAPDATMTQDTGPEPFKGPRRVFYTISAAGWTLIESLLLTYYVVFLLPPQKRIDQGMIQYVSDEHVLFGLTALGTIMLFGRAVDAVADPLVASWSDRSRSRFGRRRLFLAIGGLPLALTAVAVFYPPVAEQSWINTVYLALVFGAYFFSFTLYVGPYLSLIPELGHNEKERLFLTTAQGYWTLIGSAVVMIGGPLLISALMQHMPALEAYRAAVIIMIIPGLIFCYSAVCAVDEKRFSDAEPSSVPLKESFTRTIANRRFLTYLLGNMALWFFFNTVRSSSVTMALVLGRGNEAFASVIFAVVIGGAAICFPVIAHLARRIGKKRLMLAGLLLFAVSGIGFFFTGIVPVDRKVWMVLFAAVAAFPAAVLIVVPKVMLSEICNEDSRFSGERREGMFFGTQGFFQKLNLGVSGAVIAGMFSVFGNDVDDPLGVRLVPLIASVIALIGFLVMLRYEEPDIERE